MSAVFHSFQCRKKRLPSVFATGKVRYIRRIIARFGKVSIKQFFFKYDSCACAVYLFSNQDQEMNVNEKQSAQFLKESRYQNRCIYFQRFTCRVFYITDSPSDQIQPKLKILLQYAVNKFSCSYFCN